MKYSIDGVYAGLINVKSGVGKTGKEWKVATLLLEVVGYKDTVKKLAFSINPDIVPAVSNGQLVSVGFELDTREYNGNYYSQFNARSIGVVGGAATNVVAPPKSEPAKQAPSQQFDDVLPF